MLPIYSIRQLLVVEWLKTHPHSITIQAIEVSNYHDGVINSLHFLFFQNG